MDSFPKWRGIFIFAKHAIPVIKNLTCSFATSFGLQTMGDMINKMETTTGSTTSTNNASCMNIIVDDNNTPVDILTSPKPTSLLPTSKSQLSPPDSLRRMLSSGSPLKSSRSAYPIDFDRIKKRVETKLASADQSSVYDLYGYDYGYGADEDASPKQREQTDGTKRRKFERRNSKTEAMLRMSIASPLLCHLDFLEEKKELEKSFTGTLPIVSSPQLHRSSSSTIAHSPRLKPRALPNFDVWDGGLEIAEDLVMQLQKRKRPSKP
jgi:hypothetical protein